MTKKTVSYPTCQDLDTQRDCPSPPAAIHAQKMTLITANSCHPGSEASASKELIERAVVVGGVEAGVDFGEH